MICLTPHIPGSALQTPSEDFATGYSHTEEGRVRDTASYMANRDLFTSGLEMERSEQTTRRENMRESANRISLNKRVSGGTLHVAVLRSYRKPSTLTTTLKTAYYFYITEHQCHDCDISVQLRPQGLF